MRTPNITERALRALSNTQSLSSLGFDNTDISDEGLTYLEELRNLTHLTLHGSKMTDQGVKKSLSRLATLKHLRISDTPITDEGLAALEDLPALEFLTVQETEVTQAGLDRFQKAQPDCRVFPKTIPPTAD